VAHLFDIAPQPAAGRIFPLGLLGVWAAIPFAIAMFSGVEGVALAAEETADSHRHIPKGLVAAVMVLALFAISILVALPGAVGSSTLGRSSDPVADALVLIETSKHALLLSYAIRLCALAGLAASFLGLTYACSRQVFGLSRAGGLPQTLALLNSRGVPGRAALWPNVIGMLLALSISPERLVVSCVMGASLSYVGMTAAHGVLKRLKPTLHRAYTAPFHVVLPIVALALSILTGIACVVVAPQMALVSAGLLLALTFGSLVGGRDRGESTAVNESGF
jgi:ethanolamine permease